MNIAEEGMNEIVWPTTLLKTYQILHRVTRLVPMLVYALTLITIPFLSKDTSFASESQRPQEQVDKKTSILEASVFSHALRQVAQKAHASVVNITVKTHVTDKTGLYEPFPFFNNPFPQQYFDPDTVPDEEIPLPESPGRFSASGVIISSDGYILTNYHVIDQAYDIRVLLDNKRSIPAQVVGQDPKTDLAVLKINANDLPALTWGDSRDVKVGEIVMAIGNPFGLNQTMTIGVISAVGHASLDVIDYESFIQTDIVVNSGLSGGALINLKGELIGITTELLRESHGNMGIGFAIPSQLANTISTLLRQHGKVIRGWMGIATQKLAPAIAKQLNDPIAKGVVITELAKNGPADRAQFQRRDIIRSFQGKSVNEPRQLQAFVETTKPGTQVTITRFRDGQEKDVTIKIREFPFKTRSPPQLKPVNKVHILGGVTVEVVPKDFVQGKGGVLVSTVTPGSLADTQGLEEGDVILDINQTSMQTVKDFLRQQDILKRKDTALLLIRRENTSMFLTISSDT